MEITEVRIKLMEDPGERLQAFCSITFDNCFVIRDLKIIDGTNGPFVAMPSRKLTAHCPQCGTKNHLRAAYCNQCGLRLKEDRTVRDEEGRAKLYADIAHPINSSCRELIQQRVIAAYREEIERSKLPGYVPSYSDFDDEVAAPAIPRQKAAIVAREVDEQKAATVGRGADTVRSSPPRPAAQGQPHVEPPEQPRGPHKAPARQTTTAAPHRLPKDSFGAGIL